MSFLCVKAGVHLNVVFPPLNMSLIEIPRSRFKQSRNSLLISQFYNKGCFVDFFGDFWVYLGGDSFSQRIGKIRRNKKFGRLNVV